MSDAFEILPFWPRGRDPEHERARRARPRATTVRPSKSGMSGWGKPAPRSSPARPDQRSSGAPASADEPAPPCWGTMCDCARCRQRAANGMAGPRRPFDDDEEIDLAMELLSVSGEQELDQFLGKLFKGAWKGAATAGSLAAKVAAPLGRALKGVASTALPFVARALGGCVPVAGVGAALGSALGGALGQALQAELAGIDPAQQELETARRFVRIAASAARQIALLAPRTDIADLVHDVVDAAMRRHLPRMAQPVIGRWRMRRRMIELSGA